MGAINNAKKSKQNKVRILAVEDEPAIARIIKNSLKRSGNVVDVIGDGAEAIERVELYDYDVIILDIMLPNVDGFEICRHIRSLGLDAKIIMLTARDDVDSKISGLNVGADDYLTKPFSVAELEARVRAVSRRTKITRREKIKVGPLAIDQAARIATIKGKELKLLPIEFRLLTYLALHKNEVCTRTMLSENVWGDKGHISNVIEATLSKLRGKIKKLNQGIDLVQTIPKSGYRLIS